MPGHEEKPEACDCCGWPAADLEEFDAYARTVGHGPGTPDDEKEWAWLCRVCADTPAGTAYLYPRNHADTREQLQTIAWGINYLASWLERLAVPE